MARSKGKKGREGNGKRGGEGMTKRLSLPVLNCDGCGACCQEQAALPVSWYLVIVPLLGRPTGLPPALLSELESMRDRFFADGFPPDGSPCIWYDPETKQCRHYEHRPEVCRELQVGGEGCLRWRAMYGVGASAST